MTVWSAVFASNPGALPSGAAITDGTDVVLLGDAEGLSNMSAIDAAHLRAALKEGRGDIAIAALGSNRFKWSQAVDEDVPMADVVSSIQPIIG